MWQEELLTVKGDTVLTLSQTAKLLNFKMGRTKFMSLLRESGLLLKNNEPSQAMIDEGYMVFKLKTIRVDGQKMDVVVTLVTIKGLLFLKRRIYRQLFIEKQSEMQMDENPII